MRAFFVLFLIVAVTGCGASDSAVDAARPLDSGHRVDASSTAEDGGGTDGGASDAGPRADGGAVDAGAVADDGGLTDIDADRVVIDAGLDAPVAELDGGACAPGTWRTEAIDTTGDVGSASSLAIDATGRLHVAYVDSTNGHLRYALRDVAGTWTTSTVDASGDVSSSLDLALDADGDPHVAYFDQTSDDLDHATREGTGGWSIETVESTGDVGLWPSIAIDEEGTAHVSYHGGPDAEPYGAGLRYAYRTSGGAWTPGIPGAGDSLHTALAVIGTTPHIFYALGVAPYQELAMLSRTGGPTEAWDLENTIDAPRPRAMSAAADPSGGLHVVFHHYTSPILGYASRPAGGEWTVEEIDSLDRAAGNNSLAIDDAGGLHVAYSAPGFTGSSYDLRYAYAPPGGSWTTTTVTAIDRIGEYLSIAIDPDGIVHVTYYHPTMRDLMHAWLCAP
jgi:hypothetical protein